METSVGRMKIKLDLSSYATEAYLINAASVDTPKLAKKVVIKIDIDTLKNVATNLRNLIGKVDELDVDKLVPVFVDLSKLTDEVKTAIKKDVYNAKIYLMLLILLIMLK